MQGLSGTGSLRLGAAFIQRYFPGAKVLISSPTWGEFLPVLSVLSKCGIYTFFNRMVSDYLFFLLESSALKNSM